MDATARSRYADAVVRSCLRIVEGELLAIHGEPAHAPFVEALTAAGYRAGARFVDVVYVDPRVRRARLLLARDASSLANQPLWHDARMRALIAEHAGIVSIAGPSEPDLLADADPARAALDRSDRLPGRPRYLRAVSREQARFCVVAWPLPGWAAPVYPELDAAAATARVGEDLLRFSRLGPDDGDGTASWDAHVARLVERARAVTALDLDALELRGPGTELDMGLARGTRFMAAEERTAWGLSFTANLPTEEVFTSPDARRTNGTFRCTRPLGIDGRTITGLAGEFRAGRVVRIEADRPADREFFAAHVATDRSAGRLGEVALVDSSSRIGRTGRTYGTTLLDENAASHIAFGSGFAGSRVADAEARGTRGINRSKIHTDVMIGSDQLEVTGVRRDGSRLPVILGGTWQL